MSASTAIFTGWLQFAWGGGSEASDTGAGSSVVEVTVGACGFFLGFFLAASPALSGLLPVVAYTVAMI